MPLQNSLPVIDDRSYDSIVAEVRSRIPRYTPEWTNLNETDPGIIMIELFAWLTEMQIFRMAQIPELNYLKFLELMGIELETAKAATVQINFPMLPAFSKPFTIVPAKTQVSTEQPDEQGNIIFETDKAAIVIRAALADLLADDGFNFRGLTNDNLDTTVSFQPFGPAAVRDNAFMLGFNEELPEATVLLSVWVPVARADRVASQCYSKVEASSSTQLVWEYWNGREWATLTLLKDDTAALTRTGEIQLNGPATGKMVAESFGDVVVDRYWIRARIVNAGYDEAPKILAIRTNTVKVTQAETFEFETVGGSIGEIDQIVRLRNAPVIPGTLLLHVDEGPGYQPWQEVSDFFGSGGDDPHYVLNRATGEIRFGDGTHGRVPVANVNNRANIRAVAYRVGGGKRGNAAAGKINKLMNTVAGVKADAVTNFFAAAGGADEESLGSAKKRAPQALKSHDRAVTAEDYEELAIRAANIARAKALPLYHPDYPGIEVPGVVSVIVVPDIDGDAPVPSEGTVQAVCAYLNERRLLTSELYVLGPRYQTVKISAHLIAEETADLAEIKASALASLQLYFHPLHGGETSDPAKSVDDPSRSGGGWPFGGDIYYSLLYRRLLFSGVKRIVTLDIEVDGDSYPACQDVTIATDMLLSNGEHEITVNYEVAV
jgi:predicted phage baseplate assembly protein